MSRKTGNSLKSGGKNSETTHIMVGICYKTWVNPQGRVNALLHSGSHKSILQHSTCNILEISLIIYANKQISHIANKLGVGASQLHVSSHHNSRVMTHQWFQSPS